MKVALREPRQLQELDREIEALREKLYRLVSSNPSQLRTPQAYELSTQLDAMIARLQASLATPDERWERSGS
ncbi:MAG TPA: aspartyl-phosphate phosphatase Spo0E family protein [Firmicutes bacterium]|nr:aspartyl-phosphate phosphatase Spo0E family protein [Bacillota bacterium]